MPWSLRSFDVARFLNVQHRRQPGAGVGPLDARDPRHAGNDVADALGRGARPLEPAALLMVGGEVTREQLERADDDGEGVVDLVGGGARQERDGAQIGGLRSEEHTSELQSRLHLVCRLLLEKKKKKKNKGRSRVVT